MGLLEVNFSIVSYCNASCVFCPRSEFKSNVRFMPLELVKKVMDEITKEGFKHKIVNSYIGENGEATLHPDFLGIVREVNRGGYKVDMFTNFSNLTPEISRVVIEENLLTGVHTNIDGFTASSYRLMKGLDYERMEKNVLAFLDFRKTYRETSPVVPEGFQPHCLQDTISGIFERSRLFIHVITAEKYIDSVHRWFGTYPHKLPPNLALIENEAELIKEKWLQHINFKQGDRVTINDSLMWAERDYTEKREGDFSCHNMVRLESNAFIAPNGDWYLCCFDEKNQLVLGNLYEQSLEEIYESDRRKNIIQLLKEKKFSEVGPPCNRVDACKVL